MKKTLAAALVLSLAFQASAQTLPPPPPPPDDVTGDEPLPLPAEEVGYFSSCFGVPRVGMGPFGIAGEVAVPVDGRSGVGIPTLPVSSDSKDDKAWLVVAVVAAAALPVVVYMVDAPAPRLVLQRFRCPTFSLDLVGGADNGRAVLGGGSYGFVTTRLTFGVDHFGTEVEYVGSPGAVSAFSAHFLLRPTPKAHLEGGLAIGYRRSVLGDRVQDGFEIGLPHRYALWRDGLRTLALELRPQLLIGSGVEPSLEAAVLIPLAQVMHLRVGGRVYTFEGDLLWGLSAGLSLTL